jgi:hypothetical protein
MFNKHQQSEYLSIHLPDRRQTCVLRNIAWHEMQQNELAALVVCSHPTSCSGQNTRWPVTLYRHGVSLHYSTQLTFLYPLANELLKSNRKVPDRRQSMRQ